MIPSSTATRPISAEAIRVSRWPVAISLVAASGILAIALGMVLDLRDHVGTRARETSENLVRVIERDIARNIEVLNLALQGVVDGVAKPGLMSIDPELRRLVLFDRSATASGLGALVVFDADGKLTLDSAGIVPRSIAPVFDREYFQAQHERGTGLYISRPYRSRLIGQDVVGFSRRLPDVAGSFAGVVLATIQISYFTDLLSKLQLGSDSVVSLVRDDGAVLVRQSRSGVQTTGDLSGSPVFQRMRTEGSGTFPGTSRIDGVERLYTFTRIGTLPLYLSVGMATTDIYSAWAGKAALVGAVLFVISLVLVGLMVVLTRELGRRARAEHGLVRANAELARLSITDPLTELGNRRQFDESLAREMRRAARTGGKLSLVLLDVDHFKRFNDRYGHQEGDGALQAIAAVLREGARRPGDKAFRIGGEEFAAILPETGVAGALAFAEAIRLKVRSLARPHADSPAGVMTLSQGIAEIGNEDVVSAFARADAALYAAKREGRDRVSVNHDLAKAA